MYRRISRLIVPLFVTVLMATPALFVTNSYATSSAFARTSSACVTFEDLALGTTWNTAAPAIPAGGVQFDPEPFQWADGTWTGAGTATVENGGAAGGSGNELNSNNISLVFALTGDFANGAEYRFGEYGGNINLSVNGDFVNFNNYQDIHGATIGGVTVSVINGSGSDNGIVRLSGAVATLTMGGQEHYIDDLCPINDQSDGAPDLGDAPDSRNHSGSAMTTYGGAVGAEFPSVFDRGANPPGPRHENTQLTVWLGDKISAENEAGQGPDADPTNNILPLNNKADLDLEDDGLRLPAEILHCEPMNLEFKATASALVTPNQNYYVNIWLDYDRSGQWGETLSCPHGVSEEWAIQNQMINFPVAGPHTFLSNTFIPNNRESDRPMWIRISITEEPFSSNRAYGLPNGFARGETEDYYFEPPEEMGGIHGHKWNDINGNGEWDENEPPIQGWEIQLVAVNGHIQTTRTNERGEYWFENLPAEQYFVQEVQRPMWRQTYPASVHYQVDYVPGQSINGLDFGNQEIPETGGIHGYKINDLNGDGDIDRGEPKIPGWEMTLTDEHGNQTTTVTNDEGVYWFDDLPVGVYTVTEEMRPGWIQTAPVQRPHYVIDLEEHGHAVAHFWNQRDETPMPGIHGFKWHDLNQNGAWETEEPPIENWWIHLHDSNGNWVASTQTNDTGEYWFTEINDQQVRNPLPMGDYYVLEQLEVDWQVTYPPTMSVPGMAPVPAHFVQLTAANNNHENVNFGNYRPDMPGIHGHKWHDLDGNGKWESHEPPISFWYIELLDANGNFVGTTSTDERGEYWFVNGLNGVTLVDGQVYHVREMQQSGWEQTFPPFPAYKFAYAEGQSMDGLDFGNKQHNMPGIHGRKWNDLNNDGIHDSEEPGIADWKITLTDSQGNQTVTHTDADGWYWFTHIPADIYTVTEEMRPNWVQTYPAWDNGAHIVNYFPGESFGLFFDFGNHMPEMPGIHGYKWNDLNGDGLRDTFEPVLAEWEINLHDSTGMVIATTHTNQFGAYWFTHDNAGQPIISGEYYVSEIQQPGWMQTFPPHSAGVVPDAHHIFHSGGGSTNDVNFGNTDRPMPGIHGRKWHDLNSDGQYQSPNAQGNGGEPFIEGWTIYLKDVNTGDVISTTTNADGMYWFTDLISGKYIISEEQRPGWMQTHPVNPNFYHVVYGGEQTIDRLDFGNSDEVMPGAHGHKWFDVNGNGVWDDNEPPIAGWPIEMESANGEIRTTYTNEQGQYWFVDMPNGSYTIRELMYPNWEQTAPSTMAYQFDLSDTFTTIDNLDFGNNRETCPMDVAVVLDTSQSMAAPVTAIHSNINMLVDAVKLVSGNDYQLSLVRFDDDIAVEEILAPNNGLPFKLAVTALTSGGGGAVPNATDESLNTAINSLNARVSQSGDFPNNWRGAGVQQIVILVTAAPPGGFDDNYAAGIDDASLLARISEANTNGMLVSAVQYQNDPTASTLMSHVAMGTGGFYHQTANFNDVPHLIRSIIEECGGHKSAGIHGIKWHDLDGQGDRDADEPTIKHWPINLLQNGVIISKTHTDARGEYWFTNLPAGDYSVEEVLLAGWRQTFPTSGHHVTIAGTESYHDRNFGNILDNGGGFCGRKYNDLDRNHDFTTGDVGLEDWVILLTDIDTGETISTKTDVDGNYCFDDVPLGSYNVSESQHRARLGRFDSAAWGQSEPITGVYSRSITTAGQRYTDVDFGNWEDPSQEYCHIYWDTHFTDFSHVDVQVEVYNDTGSIGLYDSTMIGLPAGSPSPFGALSGQDGSTTFTMIPPGSHPLVVAPNTMRPFGVRVDYPSNMVMGGGWAFYQAVVSNRLTGNTFGCIAALWPPDQYGVQLERPNDNIDDGVQNLEGDEVFEWVLENNGNDDLLIGIRIENMAPPADATQRTPLQAGGISINEMAPGTAYEDSISLQAGMTRTVSVTVGTTTRNATSGVHDLLFNADTDGDGESDIVNSQSILVNVIQEAVPSAVNLSQTEILRATPLVAALITMLLASVTTLMLLRRRKRS
ncbi:MAG: SdrD B-like domain-containing protein [Candidatus Promineifilaceae bacterium]